MGHSLPAGPSGIWGASALGPGRGQGSAGTETRELQPRGRSRRVCGM